MIANEAKKYLFINGKEHLDIKVTKLSPTCERNRRFRVNKQTDVEPGEDLKNKQTISFHQESKLSENLKL